MSHCAIVIDGSAFRCWHLSGAAAGGGSFSFAIETQPITEQSYRGLDNLPRLSTTAFAVSLSLSSQAPVYVRFC